MTKFIGRQLNVGIAHEGTRGTAQAVQYWVPKLELKIDEMAEQLINEASYGVIADAEGTDIVHKNSVGELKARIGDESVGLLLLGILGQEDSQTLIEAGVYDHYFDLSHNAQHPTLTISIEDPNDTGANGLQYALSAIDKLKIDIEPKKYAEYTVNFRGNAKTDATLTPDYTTGQDNVFLPHHGTVGFAVNLAGLATPTIAEIKKFSLTVEKNLEDDRVIGNIGVADRLNKQFVVSGTIEILYNDRAFIDQMLNSTASAMRINFQNTDKVIGTTSNPALIVDFAKVKFTEIARDMANNDFVKQTLSFKVLYSISENLMMSAIVRNTLPTAY